MKEKDPVTEKGKVHGLSAAAVLWIGSSKSNMHRHVRACGGSVLVRHACVHACASSVIEHEG